MNGGQRIHPNRTRTPHHRPLESLLWDANRSGVLNGRSAFEKRGRHDFPLAALNPGRKPFESGGHSVVGPGKQECESAYGRRGPLARARPFAVGPRAVLRSFSARQSVQLREIAVAYELDNESVVKAFAEFQALGMITLSGNSSAIVRSPNPDEIQ
jgi:hypothetical protein